MTDHIHGKPLTLMGLLARNIERWRWRFILMAILVAGSVSVALLYGSMLETKGTENLDQVKALAIPYDVQIQLASNQRPLNEFPVLATYTYTSTSTPSIIRGRSTGVPVTVSSKEEALAFNLQTSLGDLEILGVGVETQFLRQGQIQGSWPQGEYEIYLPKDLAENHDLHLEDELIGFYKNKLGIKEKFVFTVSAIGQETYDLDQPQVDFATAQAITVQQSPNRQFLKISGFDMLRDFTFFNNTLARLYPGANFILKETPALRYQELNKAIQSPGTWVIFLVFFFMAVAVLTLNLLAFLERKQESAILKTLGLKNRQAVILFLAESGTAGLIGLIVGLLGSAILFNSSLTTSILPWSKFLKLTFLNTFLVSLFFILAIVYPLLLAKAAGVNQLLYSREIPLFKRSYDYMLKPPRDWLEEMALEKTHILKLSVVDGKSLSVILRWPEESVKKGETIAFKFSYGGFIYEEWLAPVDGKVLSYNEANGKYIIEAEDKNAPHYPYPAFAKRG